MNLYGVTGWKNTGKTGLMERLVAEMVARGLTVSTVKHAHHDTEIDHPGRDSYRHRVAGAREVVLSSPRRWAVMHELREQPEPILADLLTRLSPVDLVLIEGYKRADHPKIESYRAETGRDLLARDNPTIRAVASDVALDGLAQPVFHLDDTSAIADFILHDLGVKV
ncbi:MAG: molybdopterin-guanine dinucleotide biosynthesis protein B [Roseinatronobacter sp.]|nr:MAG: molybdopterin-guanine dinucleotide biosynthesis protein B [Roseinatronobacter sp.]